MEELLAPNRLVNQLLLQIAEEKDSPLLAKESLCLDIKNELNLQAQNVNDLLSQLLVLSRNWMRHRDSSELEESMGNNEPRGPNQPRLNSDLAQKVGLRMAQKYRRRVVELQVSNNKLRSHVVAIQDQNVSQRASIHQLLMYKTNFKSMQKQLSSIQDPKIDYEREIIRLKEDRLKCNEWKSTLKGWSGMFSIEFDNLRQTLEKTKDQYKTRLHALKQFLYNQTQSFLRHVNGEDDKNQQHHGGHNDNPLEDPQVPQIDQSQVDQHKDHSNHIQNLQIEDEQEAHEVGQESQQSIQDSSYDQDTDSQNSFSDQGFDSQDSPSDQDTDSQDNFSEQDTDSQNSLSNQDTHSQDNSSNEDIDSQDSPPEPDPMQLVNALINPQVLEKMNQMFQNNTSPESQQQRIRFQQLNSMVSSLQSLVLFLVDFCCKLVVPLKNSSDFTKSLQELRSDFRSECSLTRIVSALGSIPVELQQSVPQPYRLRVNMELDLSLI